MPIWGFIIAFFLFKHFQRRARKARLGAPWTDEGGGCWQGDWARAGRREHDRHAAHWDRHRRRFEAQVDRQRRRFERRAARRGASPAPGVSAPPTEGDSERSARRRARLVGGFYIHLTYYLAVMALLALINLMTTPYPWFIWPVLGWGIGIFAHYMAVFGTHLVRERLVEPAVEREVRRERVVQQTEKQASIDELSSTIAHEIRNPIAAAKSLVQQMGEDPHSVENVEYARVALEELDRVERRVAHLLKFAKEEDYTFAPVGVAAVVDSALTQLKAKLDAAHVQVARNYIGGPTVMADADKLRGVFANILDNAIDAFASVPEGRRIDLFVENGGRHAVVRIRDNACGIPPEKLERVFNPFFTTKEKGTGLGMAISRKTVEAHEGTLDAVSEVGRGSEFRVTLPIPGKDE